jgi:hypothetical protein
MQRSRHDLAHGAPRRGCEEGQGACTARHANISWNMQQCTHSDVFQLHRDQEHFYQV